MRQRHTVVAKLLTVHTLQKGRTLSTLGVTCRSDENGMEEPHITPTIGNRRPSIPSGHIDDGTRERPARKKLAFDNQLSEGIHNLTAVYLLICLSILTAYHAYRPFW